MRNNTAKWGEGAVQRVTRFTERDLDLARRELSTHANDSEQRQQYPETWRLRLIGLDARLRAISRALGREFVSGEYDT
jgi:hypothetical protein